MSGAASKILHWSALLNKLGLSPETEWERLKGADFNQALLRQGTYKALYGSGTLIGMRLDPDQRAIEDAAYWRGYREGVILAVAQLLADDFIEVDGLEL